MKKLLLVLSFLSTYSLAEVIEIQTQTDLQKALESEAPVVIDIYRKDCPPCKRLAKTLETLAQEFADKVLFIKIPSSSPLITLFNTPEQTIRGVPTLLFWYKGEVLPRTKGAQPEKTLRFIIKHLISLSHQ